MKFETEIQLQNTEIKEKMPVSVISTWTITMDGHFNFGRSDVVKMAVKRQRKKEKERQKKREREKKREKEREEKGGQREMKEKREKKTESEREERMKGTKEEKKDSGTIINGETLSTQLKESSLLTNYLKKTKLWIL